MRMRTGRYYLKHTINHRVDAYYRQKQRDNYARAIHNSSNSDVVNSNNTNEDASGCVTALIIIVMIIAFIIIVNL